MARAPKPAHTAYSKVSATLEEPVLRSIRERTPNVSGFLNAAAKEKLYFEFLRETEAELERRGVPFDEAQYRHLVRRYEALSRPKRRARAAGR